MPRLENVRNAIWQPIYDTVSVAIAAAGARTLSFFSTPLGGILTGAILKTLGDTNLRQAGKLPGGAKFDLEGISLYVKELDSGGARPVFVDLQGLCRGFLELKFGTKTFLEIPMQQIPDGGAALSYFSNIAAAATEFHVNKGVNAVANYYRLRETIKIEDNEDFRVDMTLLNATTVVMDLTCVLWGTLYGVVN